MLEKTLESPLDCKVIKPVNPKGNQSWIFFGRIDARAETPILWPPDAKNWLTGKDSDAGKGWRQEKGMTEDEMIRMASPSRWTWVWVSSGSWWWTGKPGVLQSMGSQRVGHDWLTELNWFLPGKSHGQRSLVGYRLWGSKESDTTERLAHTMEAMDVEKQVQSG